MENNKERDLPGFLEHLSDDELAAELERRKKKADTPPAMVPLEIRATNEHHKAAKKAFNGLRKACKSYIDQVLDDHPEPNAHYIEETAMELFYGPDYWKWHSKKRA